MTHVIKGMCFCILDYFFSSLSELSARHDGKWFLLNNKTNYFFDTLVWTGNLQKPIPSNPSYQVILQTLDHSWYQPELSFSSRTSFTCNDKTYARHNHGNDTEDFMLELKNLRASHNIFIGFIHEVHTQFVIEFTCGLYEPSFYLSSSCETLIEEILCRKHGNYMHWQLIYKKMYHDM